LTDLMRTHDAAEGVAAFRATRAPELDGSVKADGI
jgi:hypothetical protein